jgi:hypothetical protein
MPLEYNEMIGKEFVLSIVLCQDRVALVLQMSKKLKPRTRLGLEFSRHNQDFNFVQKSVQTLDYDYGTERNGLEFFVLLFSAMNLESGYHICVVLKNPIR